LYWISPGRPIYIMSNGNGNGNYLAYIYYLFAAVVNIYI